MINRNIILVGDDPRLNTGFSKIINRFVKVIKDSGNSPIVIGLKPYSGKSEYKDCLLYNASKLTPGNPLGTQLIRDLVSKQDIPLVISVGDPWDIRGVAEAHDNITFKWIGYTPVESIPYPRYILIGAKQPLQYLDAGNIINKADVLVTYSKFGSDAINQMIVNELGKPARNIDYIYLGVDHSIFKPVDKKKARQIMQGVSEDDILFMCNKANSPRVGYEILLESWSKFIKLIEKKRPHLLNKVKLYLHTNLDTPGASIPALIKYYNISNSVLIQKDIKFGQGIPEQAMALVYGAIDVYVSAAKGEGFGLPILESMATGIPCIIPKYGCPIEFASQSSKVIDIVGYYNPDFSYTKFAIVNSEKFANAMFDLATDIQQRQHLGKVGYNNSLSFSWDIFDRKWNDLIISNLEDCPIKIIENSEDSYVNINQNNISIKMRQV
jgi:glycosyltransferase involved in cell wall biosynthesis